MNVKGKVITKPKEKRKITLEHFELRMRKRAVKDNTREKRFINNELFKKKLELARTKQSPPFQMKELKKVCNSLKSGKS